MSLRPLIEQKTYINAYPFPFCLVKIWSEDHFVPFVVLGCGAVRCGFVISSWLGWCVVVRRFVCGLRGLQGWDVHVVEVIVYVDVTFLRVGRIS